jgi:ATP-dependent helicase/nuclease subunit A
LEKNNTIKFSYVNLNLSLSTKLLKLTVYERQLYLQQILQRIISNEKGDALLLDNTEILFDTKLAQDPIRCLNSISRERIIIASWSGTYVNNKLSYAEPSHPEFYENETENLQAIIQTVDRSKII